MLSITRHIYLRLHFKPLQRLNRWSNHNISTLKLLQIVHRHGDRTPLGFPPNDPYKDPSYWKTGFGHLTPKGKHRMYKLGQFVRQEYNSYLGEEYSPREVYARSSVTQRCVESVLCLLSGAYPPKPEEWQWNNGSDAELGHLWQPIPIETFMPKSDDLVLNQIKRCPIANRELINIYKSNRVKQFLKDNSELYESMSKIVGHKIDTIKKAHKLHSTLRIEIDSGYYWKHVWTKEEERRIVSELYYSNLMTYRNHWISPVRKRLRAGGLVKELNNNFQKVIDNQNDKKLYVYSTHDTQVAALMHALNIFNDNLVPFGATLLFELHQDLSGDYFVKVYYHNQTLTGTPYAMHLTDCENKTECPLLKYFESTEHLIYTDFEKECNAINDV